MKKKFVVFISLLLLQSSIFCQVNKNTQSEEYPIPKFLIYEDFKIIESYMEYQPTELAFRSYFTKYGDYGYIIKENLDEMNILEFEKLRIPIDIYNSLYNKYDFSSTFINAYQRRIDFIKKAFLDCYKNKGLIIEVSENMLSIRQITLVTEVEFHDKTTVTDDLLWINFNEKGEYFHFDYYSFTIDKDYNIWITPYKYLINKTTLPACLEDLKNFGL